MGDFQEGEREKGIQQDAFLLSAAPIGEPAGIAFQICQYPAAAIMSSGAGSWEPSRKRPKKWRIMCTALWGNAPSVFRAHLRDNRDRKDTIFKGYTYYSIFSEKGKSQLSHC
jgi:hypothetical protein